MFIKKTRPCPHVAHFGETRTTAQLVTFVTMMADSGYYQLIDV